MTVTLNIDEEIVERARKVAEERGLSLDEFFGDVVQGIASRDVSTMPIEQVIKELEFLWATSSGDSRGRKWTREELHVVTILSGGAFAAARPSRPSTSA